ncbi:sigma-70 family RNA polymerase sigma factor [Planomonospora sp. ID82291]|uniref:sigma-70 family RNA polymerase sigma factor n=1 Tax=Planomonospora sp. ID82291 TaxID=2738136 RepID=UPI0018C39BF4|nr:sigma-70 family RNA polymerase sigma factor [Planomonospora sp. ID82291]MBG0818167.1 sigma-70 family RNA polymerase sigma factor [Planomonospora sp. ID82291]
MTTPTRPAADAAAVAAAASAQMRSRLVAFVAARIDRPDEAEDIVQEVLARISRSAAGPREAGRLEAWVYQITRNAIIDHHRTAVRAGQAQTRAAFDRSLTGEAADPGALSALAGCLAPMLEQLPERDRQAVTLVDYEGLTQAEAARRLGLSVPGMKSRVQRARARLRTLLLACCQVAVDARGRVSEVRPAGACPCGG